MTDDQSVLLVNSPICRLCLKVYQDPKILSCLHSFCYTCLEQLHTTQVVQSQLTCPVCDVDTDIPPSGISSLTNNAFLNRISQDYIEAVKSTITKKPTENLYGTGLLEKYKHLHTSKEKVHLPEESKKNVSVIFEKLRSELLHLQQEALRTTYSIEKVTDTVSNWTHHNAELKNEIQRRSSVLQHLIRRHETQMIAQLAHQQYTDKFSQDIETAKCGLKQNLKNIIQAIEFIKQVQEFATEHDVLDMKEFLLGKLATLNKVSINYKQYFVDFEDTNIAEIIADVFGQFGSSQTQEVVYDPTLSGEVNKEQEHQEITDEENVPRRLRSRRKMNKERRLTSVVDKNWRADEQQQPTANPLSNLRENLIQRRRNLLQEYVSFDIAMTQSFQKSEIKKKKRRYHSFGGRSAQSVAPPDAATLRQINEHMHISPEQTTDVKSTFIKQNTLPAEPMITKDPPLSVIERSNITLNIASAKLSPVKESAVSIKGQRLAYSNLQPTTGILKQATEPEIRYKLEEVVNESRSMSEDKHDDKQEEEEWTVVTEEVVVMPSPPPQSKVPNTMSWETTQKSVDSTQKSMVTTQRSTESTQRSMVTTQRSVGSTQRSMDSTQRSMDSTQKSMDSTQKSMESNQKSVDSTQKSAYRTESSNWNTTQRSMESTQRSMESTQTSVESTQKSVESTQASTESIQRSGYTSKNSNWNTTKFEHQRTANVQLLKVGSESVQNGNTSDSEWTFTEEEISVPQPTPPKSPSLNTDKSCVTNLPKDSVIHGSKTDTSQSEWATNEQKISVQQVTQQTTQTMTYAPQRPIWNSQYKSAERATRVVKEETSHKQVFHEKPVEKTVPLSFAKSHEESVGKSDVKQASPGEWKVTTEEVSVPSEALSRSGVMQEDRETRLKFLRNNWRKRKDVLRQTEGFVAPVEKEMKMPSQVTSPTDSGNKIEKSVQFNIGLSIRSVLSEEKENTKVEKHIEMGVNGSRSPTDSKQDRLDNVFSTQKTSIGTKLTKDRLQEYRQNMRQKTERWRIDSN